MNYHEFSVLKTRAQAGLAAGAGLRGQAQLLVKEQGVRALYRGLVPVLCGSVPARGAYIAVLESARPSALAFALQAGFTDPKVVASIGNGTAALASVFASQLIYVPVDVVTQRVMTTPMSGSAVLRSVLATQGPIGLYRGFGISLMAYLPAQSLWWGTYGGSQAAIREHMPGTRGTVGSLAAQGASSTLAAACVVAGTSPLDLFKTRVQLSESATPVTDAMAQIRRDGMASLYKGSRARLTHMTIWGFVMISVYEELKSVCTVPNSDCDTDCAAGR